MYILDIYGSLLFSVERSCCIELYKTWKVSRRTLTDHVNRRLAILEAAKLTHTPGYQQLRLLKVRDRRSDKTKTSATKAQTAESLSDTPTGKNEASNNEVAQAMQLWQMLKVCRI